MNVAGLDTWSACLLEKASGIDRAAIEFHLNERFVLAGCLISMNCELLRHKRIVISIGRWRIWRPYYHHTTECDRARNELDLS